MNQTGQAEGGDTHPGAAGEPPREMTLSGPARPSSSLPTTRPARLVVLVFLMAALDSLDRWLFLALLPRISHELGLPGDQASWLVTVSIVGYAVAGVLVGWFVDRLHRPRMLAAGFAVWALATAGLGLTSSYQGLEAARFLTGVGGACATVTALSLLMDQFPARVRGRVLTLFFLGLPTGALLATTLGASIAAAAGWQEAFVVIASPGLIVALAAILLGEPIRGQGEGIDFRRLARHQEVGPSQDDYVDLMVNSSFTYSVFGLAFATFAIAGLLAWTPAFLTVAKGVPATTAARWLGLVLLGSSTAGLVLGGLVVEASTGGGSRRLFLIPALALFGSIVAVMTAIEAHSPAVVLGAIFVAQCLAYVDLVPCFAILAQVVMPTMRGVGLGVALAAARVVGDLWGPSVVGYVLEMFSAPDAMATVFGRFLSALGATPRALPGLDPQNVAAGLLVLVPALLIAGIVLLAGVRHLPREIALMHAKLRAAPRPSIQARKPAPRR